VCLIDGKYSKHYLKSYIEETRIDENAYFYYRHNSKSFERLVDIIDMYTLCSSVLYYFINHF